MIGNGTTVNLVSLNLSPGEELVLLGGKILMKTFVRILTVFIFIAGCFGFGGQSPASALSLTDVSLTSPPVLAVEARLNPADEKLRTEFGKLLDLNNSDIRDFRELPGFYPTLASKIIKAAPYETVEDVLNIPGLSERQKARLQANLDKFTVTPPAKEFIEGGDRINPGVY
jgi:photosystem II PsbU protein